MKNLLITSNALCLAMGALLLGSACADDDGTSGDGAEESGGSNAPAAAGGTGSRDAESGGSNTPTAGGAGSEDVSMALSCDPGEIRVRVTDSSGSDTHRFSELSHQFINKLGENPGRLEIRTDGATLQVLFDQPVLNGRSAPARGSLSLDDLEIGNCEADGNPGTLTLDEDGHGGSVVLTQLHQAPYCDEAAESWTLEGCFQYIDFDF